MRIPSATAMRAMHTVTSQQLQTPYAHLFHGGEEGPSGQPVTQAARNVLPYERCSEGCLAPSLPWPHMAPRNACQRRTAQRGACINTPQTHHYNSALRLPPAMPLSADCKV